MMMIAGTVPSKRARASGSVRSCHAQEIISIYAIFSSHVLPSVESVLTVSIVEVSNSTVATWNLQWHVFLFKCYVPFKTYLTIFK